MGEISDFFKKDLKVNQKAAKAIEAAEKAIDIVSNVISIVGIPGAVLDVLDLFLSATDETLERVDSLIKDFRAVTASSSDIAMMRDVQAQLAPSRAQLMIIRSALPGRLNEAQKALADRDTLTALAGLSPEGFWLRPFFREGVYSDGWVGDVLPELIPMGTDAQAVFDWRLTLPAYMEAITIRLFVLSALFEDYRTRNRSELLGIANRLASLHQQMAGGIRMHRAPQRDELVSRTVQTGPGPFVQPRAWDVGGRRFGAVDAHSRRNAVFSYPSDPAIDRPPDITPPEIIYRRFLLLHGLKTLPEWKAVYRDIGLDLVRRTVNHLRELAGDPARMPDASLWSVREVDQLTVNTLRQPNGGRISNISNGRISTRLILSRVLPFPSTALSMRGAFEGHHRV